MFSIGGEYDEERATLREEYGRVDQGRACLECLKQTHGGPAIPGFDSSEAAEVALADLRSFEPPRDLAA